jgi:nucleoside-diphosphate-sugar epimerase
MSKFFGYILSCPVLTILHCTSFQQEMVGPAVNGTTNVLKASSGENVRRVVVVSSMVAVEINPKDWPTDKIKDESCWLYKEFCSNNEVIS